MVFVCDTRMQQHFICILATQIQCAFMKWNIHANKRKKSECFSVTQPLKVWLYADWRKGCWVGNLLLLMERKRNWISRQLEVLPRMSALARAIAYLCFCKLIYLFLSRYIRLVTTDEDNKRLKTELSEMKARHRLEIERVTREKEQEMDEVHKRFVMDELFACEVQILVVHCWLFWVYITCKKNSDLLLDISSF